MKETQLKATKSMSTIEATPVKIKIENIRRTPRSDRKSESKVREDRLDTHKKCPLFRKIRKQKKPLERTIYHGETKKFIPRKNSVLDQMLELR